MFAEQAITVSLHSSIHTANEFNNRWGWFSALMLGKNAFRAVI